MFQKAGPTQDLTKPVNLPSFYGFLLYSLKIKHFSHGRSRSADVQTHDVLFIHPQKHKPQPITYLGQLSYTGYAVRNLEYSLCYAYSWTSCFKIRLSLSLSLSLSFFRFPKEHFVYTF